MVEGSAAPAAVPDAAPEPPQTETTPMVPVAKTFSTPTPYQDCFQLKVPVAVRGPACISNAGFSRCGYTRCNKPFNSSACPVDSSLRTC